MRSDQDARGYTQLSEEEEADPETSTATRALEPVE